MVLTSRVCSAYCKKPELRKLLVLKTRNISKFKSETFNKRLAPSSPLSDSCQSGLEQTSATLDKPVDLPTHSGFLVEQTGVWQQLMEELQTSTTLDQPVDLPTPPGFLVEQTGVWQQLREELQTSTTLDEPVGRRSCGSRDEAMLVTRIYV